MTRKTVGAASQESRSSTSSNEPDEPSKADELDEPQHPDPEVTKLQAEIEVLRTQLQAAKTEVATFAAKIRELSGRALQARASMQAEEHRRKRAERAAAVARLEADYANARSAAVEVLAADAERRCADAEARWAAAEARWAAAEVPAVMCKLEPGEPSSEAPIPEDDEKKPVLPIRDEKKPVLPTPNSRAPSHSD